MGSTATRIQTVARSHVGSKAWLFGTAKDDFKKNSNKCNKFVLDVLLESGVDPAPKVTKYLVWSRIPTAGEWADPDVKIQGWEVVKVPNVGDVAAIALADTTVATGHVAIVVSKSTTVSAASTVAGKVIENDWGFREGQQPTFRRYTLPGKNVSPQ